MARSAVWGLVQWVMFAINPLLAVPESNRNQWALRCVAFAKDAGMLVDGHIVALPSPLWFPHDPVLARRADLRAQPRAALQHVCSLLEQGLACGLTQVLLPPRIINDDVIELPQTVDPLVHYAVAWAGTPHYLACAATVIPAADSDTEVTQIALANRAGDLCGHLQALAVHAQLRRLLAEVPNLDLLDSLPADRLLWDAGDAQHWRLGALGESGIHCFVHNDALAMPAELRPQRVPALARLEAQQAQVTRSKVHAGTAFFARQHWKSADAGAQRAQQMGITSGSKLLIHQLAFADQHAVICALEDAATGVQIRQVSDAEWRLKHIAEAGPLQGILCEFDGRTILLTETGHKHAAKLAKRLQTDGFIDDSIAVPTPPHRWPLSLTRLRIPLQPEQLAAMPQGLIVTDAVLAGLRDWIATVPETLSIDEVLAADMVAQRARLADSLAACLQVPLEFVS